MNQHVMAAIRSQPWAIMPGYLEAIEAIALRVLDDPAVLALKDDGHQERQLSAVAMMGERAPGTRKAMLREGIGMLPLMGPVFPRSNIMTEYSGAASLDIAAADLRALQASPDVRQILMVIDSPGGAVAQVNDFARLVAASPKPISVHVTGLCCSAAYWIGSSAPGGISLDPTGVVGSIGVLISTSYQVEADANGRRDLEIASTNAPNKRPDLSTPEGQAVVRQMLDGIEDIFIQTVARGRGVTEATVRNEFGKGGTLTGKAAKAAGMVDRIEADGLDGAIRRLAKAGPATPRRTAAANTLTLAQIRAG
ncbi:S49 family peptidase [Sphingomonas sp. ABOLF]|uniref:S49 family peptidase n=1 Tax=Sphingomonas sp. ABOLF TaxID=1985879 RepID=UPI000F7E6EB0|nr:S49 family peptidase [Sphingomonas sp. ABOLF]RSV15189.1 S49 family peptidase [Sphingomonas sp. ABOLF]